ncbi:tetratricopeptide repeat protein [Burkholderia stagnalis]
MRNLLVGLSIVGLTACQAGVHAAAPAGERPPVVSRTAVEATTDSVPRPPEKEATAAADGAPAQATLVEACRTTDPSRCEQAGLRYVTAATESLDHAADLYARGCDHRDVASCIRLGIMFAKGDGVEMDWVAAAQRFEQACVLSDGAECTNLGLAYESGEGVERDTGRAAQLFDKACRSGRAPGCSNLATAYMKGIGVQRDRTRAISLYKGACDDGDALGCFNLGVIFGTGQGVARDLSLAVRYYGLACDRGEGEACGNLGQLRQGRQAGLRDPGAAVRLFRRGCRLGAAESCLYLGLAYQSGDGVAANVDDARRNLWRALALDPKSHAARLALARLPRGFRDEHASKPVDKPLPEE